MRERRLTRTIKLSGRNHLPSSWLYPCILLMLLAMTRNIVLATEPTRKALPEIFAAQDYFYSYVPARKNHPRTPSVNTTTDDDDMTQARSALKAADFDRARTHLLRALEDGHLIAGWYLGRMFQHGRGVNADPGQAFRYYQLAARAFDADEPRRLTFALALDALVRVADGYLTGLPEHHVPQDSGRAFKIYTLAAGHGHPGAYHGLGLIYLKGLGVRPRPRHARHWLAKAAVKRYAPTLALLGDLTWRDGQNAEERIRGVMWYILAQETADPGLRPRLGQQLELVRQKLRPGEYPQARRLAADFADSPNAHERIALAQ